MTQRIIVGIILAATAFFAVRWLVLTVSGKGKCSCHHCPHCPSDGNKECHCCSSNPHLPDIKV